MPLWLRRTTWNLMQEHFKEQNDKIEAQQNSLQNNDKTKSLAKPNIAPKPTYTTKAPTK